MNFIENMNCIGNMMENTSTLATGAGCKSLSKGFNSNSEATRGQITKREDNVVYARFKDESGDIRNG